MFLFLDRGAPFVVFGCVMFGILDLGGGVLLCNVCFGFWIVSRRWSVFCTVSCDYFAWARDYFKRERRSVGHVLFRFVAFCLWVGAAMY